MGLDAVGVVCKDVKESVRFYNLFDLEFSEVGGPEHLEASFSNGMRLMLDSVELIRRINPGWQDSSGSGLVLCFKQDTPELVDRIYRRVVEEGFHSVKEPWDAFWGQRYCFVHDPDGNQVDIFSDLLA